MLGVRHNEKNQTLIPQTLIPTCHYHVHKHIPLDYLPIHHTPLTQHSSPPKLTNGAERRSFSPSRAGCNVGVWDALRRQRSRRRGPLLPQPHARVALAHRCRQVRRRRAAVPDGGQFVWGHQLHSALLLPAGLLPSQAARRQPLRPPAAAASSEPAG